MNKAIDELFAAAKWTQSLGEEIANSVSHGLGFAAALIAGPFLFAAAARIVALLSFHVQTGVL